MTFEMDPKGREGVNHEGIWRKIISCRGKNKFKGPAVEMCQGIQGKTRYPVWLEQSEKGGTVEDVVKDLGVVRKGLKVNFFSLYSLEEKMVAAYEDSKWEPVKWENDMHCAVRIPDKNQWQRGQIIRMVTDTLVEVNAELKI